jgi:hypothetical protein
MDLKMNAAHKIEATMPTKEAPNVPLRSKLNAIVGREKERDGGRSDRETLNLFLLSRAARVYRREQLPSAGRTVETKVSVPNIGDDEQSCLRDLFCSSDTQLIVQS